MKRLPFFTNEDKSGERRRTGEETRSLLPPARTLALNEPTLQVRVLYFTNHTQKHVRWRAGDVVRVVIP